MRILFITGSLNQGGAEFQILALANLFLEKGHEVEVLAITDYKFYLPFVEKKGLTYSCLKNNSGKFRRLMQTAKKIRSFNPDIVVSYLRIVSITALIAKWLSLRNPKLVIGERTSLILPKYDKFYFNLMRFADGIVVNADVKFAYIKKNFPFLGPKTVLFPNIVRVSQQEPKSAGSLQHGPFVYVGRLSKEKNLLALIRAFKMASDSLGTKVELLLYGDAPDAQYLEQIKEEIKGFPSIRVMGKTDNVQLVYRQAALLCLLSNYEGFSNVLAEALFASLPIMTSDIPENVFLVEHGKNGFVVNHRDVGEISKAIVRYINLPLEEKIKISSNNIEKAQRIFNPDALYTEYMKFLNSI